MRRTQVGNNKAKARAADSVVPAIARCFRVYGYAGATPKRLAQATGLSWTRLRRKFPGGKPKMALAALDCADVGLIGGLRAILTGPGDPATRAHAAAGLIDKTYMHGELGCLLASFAFWDTPESVKKRARKLLDDWLRVYAAFYREIGLPGPERVAAERLANLQGALILTALSQDPLHMETALFQFHADADAMAPARGKGRIKVARVLYGARS